MQCLDFDYQPAVAQLIERPEKVCWLVQLYSNWGKFDSQSKEKIPNLAIFEENIEINAQFRK